MRAFRPLATGYLGISYGHTGGLNFGALPAIYGFMGILYMLGGLVFGAE
jgi:hypothetical protein